MSGIIPDRVSTQKGSQYYDARCVNICISIDGNEQKGSVVEFCVSSGWARVAVKDEAGHFQRNVLGSGVRVKRIHGTIKVWWKQ